METCDASNGRRACGGGISEAEFPILQRNRKMRGYLAYMVGIAYAAQN